MNSIFSLKILQLAFKFYKKFLFTCLLLTFGFLFLKMPLSLIIALKFLFFGILFASYRAPSLNQKLIFYKNFGISPILMFFISFFFDTVLTIILVLIKNQF